jgi:hypothetical protein
VCATVRFLHTLYEVLNADIVNSQVKALRAMYHGNAAIDYLAECFQKKHDLSYDNCASVKLALPKTEACLKGTKEWMRSLSEQLSINTDGRESSAFSFKMRSGIGSSSTMEEVRKITSPIQRACQRRIWISSRQSFFKPCLKTPP